MYDDLRFRNQEGDGATAAWVAVIGIAGTSLISWLGWPAVFALAGGTVALLAYKISKH